MAALTEQLIENVKLHTILYDLAHPDYKNNRLKNKVWDEMGKILGADGDFLKKKWKNDFLKKKWKNLRDSFSKHLRSEKTHTGQKAKQIEKYKMWPWVQQMSVFKPFLQFASTDSNILDETNILDEANSDTEIIRSFEVLLDPPTIDITPSKEANYKKRKRTDQQTPQTPATDKMILYLKEKESKRNPNANYDSVDLLFLGYAKTLKNMSPHRQVITKFKIAELFMQQELQEVTENASARNFVDTCASTSMNSICSQYTQLTSPSPMQESHDIIDQEFSHFHGLNANFNE